VREQIAGVEDPECSSAFVKFRTHLSLLLFAAAIWWLQKDSVRVPFSSPLNSLSCDEIPPQFGSLVVFMCIPQDLWMASLLRYPFISMVSK